MTYVDGFVIAVPKGNRDKFQAHATLGDQVIMDHGATRIVESWQSDVAKGKTTDFFGAVDCKDDEEVVFSWIEWADKSTREAFNAQMDNIMKTDERFNPEKNPMPFDGKRMIYGGFEPIVEEGVRTPGAYIQGFIVPVPEAKKEDYRKVAAEAWPWFHKHGALRVIEAWPEDVQHGQQTDFFRAIKAEDGEVPVFSFIEWPSKEACDSAHQAMESDPEMKMPDSMPFDGKRMVYGGFTPVVELGA
jgi:uncharacterized protein YbaA (DUF1428 family)